MATLIQAQLNNFYISQGIHPKKFHCPHQEFCRECAYHGQMTETKMSLVGSLFGVRFPKIVVVSLDPPAQGDKFQAPEQRTTENIAKFTEAENYTINRPNPHWGMTQIIVKDILVYFGYRGHPNAAIVTESYNGRVIENVTSYFSHVNVAKCSMNDLAKRQAPRAVHETCSSAYLMNELKILQPNILITQGKTTNEILGIMLRGKPFFESELPAFYEIKIDGKAILWMPMRHPTQQISKIRNDWPTYQRAFRYLVKG